MNAALRAYSASSVVRPASRRVSRDGFPSQLSHAATHGTEARHDEAEADHLQRHAHEHETDQAERPDLLGSGEDGPELDEAGHVSGAGG